MHRMSIVGELSQVAFEDAALDLIHKTSGGVPRLINLICDRALMAGAQADARVITAAMINTAVISLGLPPPTRSSHRWWSQLPRWATFGFRR
jgi:general secretion pathway protein A